ncbi:hypothetical protein ST47_g8869 [Ascochyta rabiei]|uniref:Pal1-domain-containing protein n=1 Tax=Didymella rabiei TaxID=5454 RepID=A0A162YGA1_DIDRA|nr:hypothetical protein ST47_g8869 [Ascochyta rabiei]
MLAESSMPERRLSPGPSPNLSSNNPFRNRATSPAFPSPAFPSPANQSDRSSSASRPMSRNPFLSTFEAEFNKEAKKTTDLIDMSANMRASPKKASFNNGSAAEELFKNLTIDDDDDRRRAPPRPMPNRSGTDPRAGHRPSRSDEERDRLRGAPRGPPRPRGPPEPRRPMQSSPDRRERRPRRNSDSSIIDKAAQEKEDRRRRERRREREDRERDGKSGSTAKKVRKPQGLDLIDKLDVTGIYGPSMIHHDGPYDAVQPHRNRKKDQRAPMHAFPVGSANNSLGGSGPLNAKIDLDRIHGRGAEGFTDFGGAESEWKKPRPEGEFSAKGREDIVHGQPTHGLGTSTFLEGAPASRTAVEQDFEQKRANEINGLGRKKSIAQRFRGISQPRRHPQGPYSAGSLAQNKAAEMNPFFDEYNKAYKDDSPPRVPLHRAVTTDSAGSLGESKPTGFLGRMKSIKGGRRRQA